MVVDFEDNAANAAVGIYASARDTTSRIGSLLTRVGSESSGKVPFNAPSGGIILRGATTYWVYVSKTTGANPQVKRTTSIVTDTGSAAGWSTGGSSFYSENGTAWEVQAGHAVQFTVNATARPSVILTAGDITRTGAELTIHNHTGAWWYKQTAPTAGSCLSRSSSQTTASLSSLVANTGYTFTAYSAAGCANSDSISSVTFTTAGALVSNLDGSAGSATLTGSATNWYANAFDTGGVSDDRYSLTSVTLDLGACAGTPVVGIYTESSSGSPGTQVGSHLANPTYIVAGQNNFTASGITLNGDTTYFVRLRTSSGTCVIRNEADDAQSGTSGWSIENVGVVSADSGSSWSDVASGLSLRFSVIATGASPRLTATILTTTRSKLTIHNHTDAWWYQRTAPTAGTCTSVTDGTTTADLSSLSANTQYTYKAYSATGCNAADQIGSASFLTGILVSNLDGTASAAILDAGVVSLANAFRTGGGSGARYTPSGVTLDLGTCAGTPVVRIYTESGGSPGTQVGSNLTNPATISAGRNTFTASGITLNGDATYFVTIWTSSGSCNVRGETDNSENGVRGWSIADVGRGSVNNRVSWINLTNSTSLRFSVNGSAVALDASAVTKTGATLTIYNHTTAWWYKQTSPSDGTCTSVTAGGTGSLSSLASGTEYTYKAYLDGDSDGDCDAADEIASETFRTAREFTAPTVISGGFSPDDDANDVTVSTNLVITFSEDVQPGTGNIVIKNLGNSADNRTIPIGDSQVSFGSGDNAHRVTINPTSDLLEGADYAVRIAGTAIRDRSSNYYAGISNDTTWNFTTIFTPGVRVTPTTLRVPKGSSAGYTVRLNTQPSGNVVIGITKRTGGAPDLSANKTSLTFNTTNWNSTQTVTISAREDGDAISGTAVFEHAITTGAGTDYPTSLGVPDVTARGGTTRVRRSPPSPGRSRGRGASPCTGTPQTTGPKPGRCPGARQASRSATPGITPTRPGPKRTYTPWRDWRTTPCTTSGCAASSRPPAPTRATRTGWPPRALPPPRWRARPPTPSSAQRPATCGLAPATARSP